MRPRGQVAVALVALAAVISGGIVLERALGPAPAGAAPKGTTSSGIWLCPHGGGRDWTVTVHIANPGDEPVTVRVRSLGGEKAGPGDDLRIDPGSTVGVSVPATERGSATSVEWFGGWVAAGWTASAGGQEKGVAAEPCASEAGGRWTLPDGTTEDGETAYVVVMNPFASDAVFDLQVLTENDPPRGFEEWTDVVLRGRRSAAFEVNEFLEGELTASVTIRPSIGRLAAASLGVSSEKDAVQPGIRSSIGLLGAPPERSIIPGAGDEGTSTLALANPGGEGSSYGVTVLGPGGLKVAKQEAAREPMSADSAGISTPETSSIVVRVGRGETGLAAARRTRGVEQDLGSSAGASAAAGAWVVLPSTGGSPQTPRIVVGNPGAGPVSVTLTALSTDGGAGASTEIRVKPGATSTAGKGLLEGDPNAAVLVEVRGGAVVPAGASYSEGNHGVASYAVSVGAPIPQEIP